MTNNKRIKFADISSKYITKPYKEYSFDENQGLDCFSLMCNFLKDYGIEYPKEFEGTTLSNYFEVWDEDNDKAIERLKRYLETFTEEKEFKDLNVGDIIICKYKKLKKRFFTIYAGNGKIFYTTHNYGVSVIPIRYIEIENIFKGYH